jgi:hypothetical protein
MEKNRGSHHLNIVFPRDLCEQEKEKNTPSLRRYILMHNEPLEKHQQTSVGIILITFP